MLRRNNIFDNGINLPVDSFYFGVIIIITGYGEHYQKRRNK